MWITEMDNTKRTKNADIREQVKKAGETIVLFTFNFI